MRIQIGNEIVEVNLPRGGGKAIIGAVVVLLLAIALLSSVYTVKTEDEAIVKRFGAVIATKPPGLHFKLPFGIDTATAVPKTTVLKEEFGFRSSAVGGARTQYRKDPVHRDESLMLTGDLKIIDVEWVVQYRVSDTTKFLHQSKDPRKTLRDISEAVMRRIVGNSLGSDVLTERRVQVSNMAREELQEILDSFELGVQISTIELQDVTPPESVKAAFNEVNQAEQERERFINEAEKRRNQVIPRAEGEANQTIAEAEGYAAERTNRALGETARFDAIRNEFENAPEVTRRRLFLEMIDEVLPEIGRIIIMEDGAHAPLPLLNLTEDTNFPPSTRAATAPNTTTGSRE